MDKVRDDASRGDDGSGGAHGKRARWRDLARRAGLAVVGVGSGVTVGVLTKDVGVGVLAGAAVVSAVSDLGRGPDRD